MPEGFTRRSTSLKAGVLEALHDLISHGIGETLPTTSYINITAARKALG